jgi:hypothetical protein
MCEYGTLKPEKRESNGEDESNWGIIYVYMETSQQPPTYYYHILIKTF